MRKGLRSAFLWVVCAALAAGMFVVLSRITNFRFENSDDSLILKGFMGFEGGSPIHSSLYTGTFLAWLLYGLSTFMPAIPWFTLFQVALLLLSCAAALQGFWRLSGGKFQERWPGALLGVLFLGVFAFFACCRVNYTTTAALAGAAALTQLLALGAERPAMPRLVLGSLLPAFLLLCAYSLRASAVFAGLALCGLGLAAMALRPKKAAVAPGRARLFWVPALLISLSIGILFGLRLWETTADPALAQALQWHNARTQLMDYKPFEQDPAPALEAAEAAGLSKEQIPLIQEWYFLDENITAEALSQLAAAYPQQAPAQRLAQAPKIISRFLIQNPRYLLAMILLAGLCLLTLLSSGRGQAPAVPIAAVLGLLGTASLLVYLAYQGRFLARGADTVIFPAAALQGGLFLLSPRIPQGRGGIRRIAIAGLCVVCLGAAGTHIALTQEAVHGKLDTVSLQREAELSRFALANPDKLIFRTPNLLRDTRLFPDVSAGIPANTILWGDWTCRLPGWLEQLKRFDLDGLAFQPEDWLRENVLFAAPAGEEPPEALLAHIRAWTGADIRSAKAGGEGSLAFYAFTRED